VAVDADVVTTDTRTALTLGVNWLFNTPQPAGAILQHHGISNTVDPFRVARRFSFIPSGGPNAGHYDANALLSGLSASWHEPENCTPECPKWKGPL
jgi:hypothetical protein